MPGLQRGQGVAAAGPAGKPAFGESLGHEPEAGAIITQRPNHGFTSIDENEQHTRAGIFFEFLIAYGDQTINTFSEVSRLGGELYPGLRG